jgi:hypothetical protein
MSKVHNDALKLELSKLTREDLERFALVQTIGASIAASLSPLPEMMIQYRVKEVLEDEGFSHDEIELMSDVSTRVLTAVMHADKLHQRRN